MTVIISCRHPSQLSNHYANNVPGQFCYAMLRVDYICNHKPNIHKSSHFFTTSSIISHEVTGCAYVEMLQYICRIARYKALACVCLSGVVPSKILPRERYSQQSH